MAPLASRLDGADETIAIGAEVATGLSVTSGRRAASPRSAAAPFADVVVFESLEASEPHWSALERTATASPYQTRSWLRAWLATEGAAGGIQPMIVVALDAGGRATALLPLGLRRAGLLRVATFLGGLYSNYNMGLFDPTVDWSAADVLNVLHGAARRLPTRLDVFAFVNQPEAWNGIANPLALLKHQTSPSFSHRAVLDRDGDAFFRAHLSSAARKKMRSKTAQLEALGPVRHLLARSPDEIEAIVTAHIAQKSAKLAAIGVGGSGDLSGLGALLARAARNPSGEPAPLELHALLCGERIVATFGGLSHAGRFSGLLISYDAQDGFARLSPGELLLARVIAAKCAEGFDGFDLGIGEARYKDSFCPIVDPLFDSFVPVTVAGTLFVAKEALRLRLKGRIKQSAWGWACAQALRKHLGRLRRMA